jgi:hypothetical protein
VIQITPNMTVEQLSKLVETCKSVSDVEVYIRIESIRGKPVAFLVREPRIPVLSPAKDTIHELTTDWLKDWFSHCREADRGVRPQSVRLPTADAGSAGPGARGGDSVAVSYHPNGEDAPF